MKATPEPPMDNDRLEDLAEQAERRAKITAENNAAWGRKGAEWAKENELDWKLSQAIRSLLAEVAAKDAEMAKVKAEARRVIEPFAKSIEISQQQVAKVVPLAVVRQVALYYIELPHLNAARTFLQENPK